MRNILIERAHYFILALTLLSIYDVYNHDLQHAIFDILIAVFVRLEINELKNLKK